MWWVVWHTRRTSWALGLTVVLSLALLAIFPVSYALPSVQRYWDTPLTRILPVFLGLILGALVYPVAPGMEALSGRRLQRARTGLILVAGVLQALILVVGVGVVNALASAGITGADVKIYLSCLVFWQALVVISVGWCGQRWGWWIPGVVFAWHLGFGFQPSSDPRVWNTIVTTNWGISVVTVVLVVVAVLVMRFGRVWAPARVSGAQDRPALG